MKKINLIVVVLLIILSACTKKEEVKSISSYDSSYLFNQGWQYFNEGQYELSKNYFTELTNRETHYLEGHLGLGWTYLRLNQLQSSSQQLNLFFDTDSLDVISITDSSFYEAKVAQALIANLSSNYTQLINLTSSIPQTWSARFNLDLNYYDVAIYRAIAYYNLQDYVSSLNQVKILDPNFTVDLSFIEGRILLAQKIEQLRLLYL